EGDTVAFVGGDALFPERLGHDTEHRAAIQLLAAAFDRVDAEVTDGAGLDERTIDDHGVSGLLRGSRARTASLERLRHVQCCDSRGRPFASYCLRYASSIDCGFARRFFRFAR